MELREGPIPNAELLALYESVGWVAYTRDPDSLVRAVGNSTYVVAAWEHEELLGLARVLTDDVSVATLQDLLVKPEHHRRGIGRALLKRALERFAHVRTWVLLTDDRPEQHAIYRAMGFCDVERTEAPTRIHAFVRMAGLKERPLTG